MPTENEEIKSVDDVWNEDADKELDDLEKDEDKEDNKEDDKKVEKEVDKEVDKEPGNEKEEDKEVDGNKEEKEDKVDWKALGLDVFEGKTQDEVAEQIKSDRKQLGHTTNMIGDLRRKISQLETKPAEEKPVEKPRDVLESIEDLNDADTAKFNSLYEKNPVNAFMTYGGDTIKQMIADEVKKSVPDVAGSLKQTKEDIEYNVFLASNKDITDEDVDQMKIFNDSQYLDEQGRSYEDLYGLSKLWKQKDIRAEKIYMLVKKHRTITFSEANELLPKPKKL